MIESSELISELRRELAVALPAGEEEALRFEAAPVDLEVTVAAERGGSATGRVRFWVVEAGAAGKSGPDIRPADHAYSAAEAN